MLVLQIRMYIRGGKNGHGYTKCKKVLQCNNKIWLEQL